MANGYEYMVRVTEIRDWSGVEEYGLSLQCGMPMRTPCSTEFTHAAQPVRSKGPSKLSLRLPLSRRELHKFKFTHKALKIVCLGRVPPDSGDPSDLPGKYVADSVFQYGFVMLDLRTARLHPHRGKWYTLRGVGNPNQPDPPQLRIEFRLLSGRIPTGEDAGIRGSGLTASDAPPRAGGIESVCVGDPSPDGGKGDAKGAANGEGVSLGDGSEGSKGGCESDLDTDGEEGMPEVVAGVYKMHAHVLVKALRCKSTTVLPDRPCLVVAHRHPLFSPNAASSSPPLTIQDLLAHQLHDVPVPCGGAHWDFACTQETAQTCIRNHPLTIQLCHRLSYIETCPSGTRSDARQGDHDSEHCIVSSGVRDSGMIVGEGNLNMEELLQPGEQQEEHPEGPASNDSHGSCQGNDQDPDIMRMLHRRPGQILDCIVGLVGTIGNNRGKVIAELLVSVRLQCMGRLVGTGIGIKSSEASSIDVRTANGESKKGGQCRVLREYVSLRHWRRVVRGDFVASISRSGINALEQLKVEAADAMVTREGEKEDDMVEQEKAMEEAQALLAACQEQCAKVEVESRTLQAAAHDMSAKIVSAWSDAECSASTANMDLECELSILQGRDSALIQQVKALQEAVASSRTGVEDMEAELSRCIPQAHQSEARQLRAQLVHMQADTSALERDIAVAEQDHELVQTKLKQAADQHGKLCNLLAEREDARAGRKEAAQQAERLEANAQDLRRLHTELHALATESAEGDGESECHS